MKKTNYTYLLTFLLLFFGLQQSAIAQWSITDLDMPFVIDFDNTVSGVNNGAFAGAGFSPTPVAGQLNSNAFITGGWSDAPNSIGFGDTSPTSGDFARGTNAGTTATGGIWGFDIGPGNRAFGLKPGGSDFTPGFVTLRLQNQTGQVVGGIDLSYNILVFNNGARSNSLNFSYSLDNMNFIPVNSLDFVSPGDADGTPSWQSNPRSAFIVNFTLNPGQYFYLRWDGDDDTGTGARDAFALDDIEVELMLDPCATLTMAEGDVIQPQCFGGDDGFISVVATGGTAPYNFSWEESASQDSVRSGLDAGSYKVYLEDNIGCLDSITINLGQPSQVTISLVDLMDETCPGAANGSIEVAATGGTGTKTFSWSNSAAGNLITNLTAGFYTVTATDANGCTAEETYEVQTINQNPVVTCPSPDTISICFGFIIDLDTLGFSPSGGVFSINGFVNGSIFNSAAENTGFNHIWYLYTDQITGCMDSCLYVINVEENPQVNASSNSPVCDGQLIQLIATGSGGMPGYTYQWDGPDNFSSNLSNPQIVAASGVTFGTYNVTVTDTNGCTAMDFVEVVEQVIGCCPTYIDGIAYVNFNASGMNNGTSWDDAFTDLQDALNSSCPGITEIWVAAGTYYPDQGGGQTNDDRNATFQLKNGVAIYGGFASTGDPTMAERDWVANITILSGDINQSGDLTNNSYTVVTGSGTDATAEMDGFTITGGNANGTFPNTRGGGMYNNNGSPTVTNCTFSGNEAIEGGGMYNFGSSPTIANVTFSSNSATQIYGGGMYNFGSSPTIANVTFTNNSAFLGGGGIANITSSPTVTNCTFLGNSAPGGQRGGGIYNDFSSPTVTNSIFSNNAQDGMHNESGSSPLVTNSIFWGSGFNGIYNLSSSPTVTNCIIWGNTSGGIFNESSSTPIVNYTIVQGGYTGTNNLNTDPLFVNAAGGDFRLTVLSPAINAGNPSTNLSLFLNGPDNPEDLDGDPRVIDDIIDMGAYESQVICPTGNVLYVNASAMGDNNGTSWDDAFTDLQDALNSACPDITQIWVATGSYYPDQGGGQSNDDRNATFHLKNGVALYGGFPNTGDPGMAERDWVANVTILSGDINQSGDLTDNSYSVVTGSGTDATAEMDGFTITGGNANGTFPNTRGGGMYNSSGSPTVTNCTFSGNTADSRGGGMYNVLFSSPTVTNCTFSGNTASSTGGGMHNISGSSPTVTNCTFSGNTASNNGGGMLNFLESSPTVTNCTFSGNSAFDGGGMHNFEYSSPTVTNCTFSGNTAGSNGGGMYNFVSSSPMLTNCILWGNSSEIENNGSNPQVNFSIVQGGYSGTGNLDVDPLFIMQPPIELGTSGNLRLQECSSAIDVGDNNALSATVILDLDGNPRFHNATGADSAIVDMGAYEFQMLRPDPTAVCQSFTVQLGTDNTVTVLAAQVNDGSSGCGNLSYLINGQASLNFDCDDVGTPQNITLSVTDAFDNTATCQATLTVSDDVNPCCDAPQAICNPATIELVGNSASLSVADVDDGSTADCGLQSITVSPNAFDCSHVGTPQTVTLTVTDINGVSSTCTTTVMVEDNTPPTVECFNQSINFNGEMSIPLDANDLVDATDNCGVQSISLSPNNVTSNQVGQTVPVLVTVTDVNGNSSTCTSLITVEGLPSGWSQNPNGVGCSDGNDVGYNPYTEVWTATSTNCYYAHPFNSDVTAFAQHTLCGNGSITAQVTGISGTALGWAGVVMRETNAPGAKKAQLTTNLSNFSRREFRTVTNGSAFPQQFLSFNRYWLRLTRNGNQFSMHVSSNGSHWFFAGAQNIVMNSCIEVGLVVTNYNSNSTVTGTFANVSVTGSNMVPLGNDSDPTLLVNYDNQQGLRDVKVYPNPTSGELNIALTGYEGRPVTMEVYNSLGQIIFMKEVNDVQSTDEIIDLSSVASGMYLIRVSSEGLSAEMKRVMVAR